MSGSSRKEPKGKAGKAKESPARPKAGSRSAADLVQALADKDRQLRELTEQSLGFLEELAEIRRHEGERQRLATRVGELERVLEDARQRLRHAGLRQAAAAGEPAPAPFELVYWGADAAPAAVASAASLPAGTVTWVGVGADLPADVAGDQSVNWLTAREARTPAQCWNLAMAATRAPWVLFLASGASLEGELAPPNHGLAPGAALLQPRLLRGGVVELGREEVGGPLQLRPRHAEPGSGPNRLSFAAPEAFFVRRAAFEAVGLFDEGLLGTLALAEYALRARAAGYAVKVAGDTNVRVTEVCEDAHEGRDLLLVLASHRPQDLGQAFAERPTLWQLAESEAAALVADAFERASERLSEAQRRQLLTTIAARMVEHALPGSATLGPLRERCADLQRVLGVEPADATGASDATLRMVFDTLALAADRLAGMDELSARVRGLEERLAAAEAERTAAQERAKVLHEELAAIATAVDLVRQPQRADVRERLFELKAEADELSRALQAAPAPDAGALIQGLADLRERLAEADRVLDERNRWIALLLHEVRKRRLFPRALQGHEQAFLDQMDITP